MKEFFKLVKQYRKSDAVSIHSATPTTEGYVLVVTFEWGDKDKPGYSVREEVIFVSDVDHGPQKGNLCIGFTHKIFYYTDERD